MSTRGSGTVAGISTFHEANLTQAAPTQDVWYDILATTPNVILYLISFEVATTGEDLECRVIIDGETYTCTQAAVAGTDYYWRLTGTPAGLAAATGTGAAFAIWSLGANQGSYPLEGKSVQVSVRKTSNAGAGTISGTVGYGTRS